MSWIVDHIAEMGEKNAVVYDYKEYTYAHLHEQILAYSKQIEGKIAKGTVVALVSDYNFYSIALFLRTSSFRLQRRLLRRLKIESVCRTAIGVLI